MSIKMPELFFCDNNLIGEEVTKITRTLKDIKDIFADKAAVEQIDPKAIAYDVYSYTPDENKPGGLNFGITNMYPGKVGDEYIMTKGHFHLNGQSTEYYWGLKGSGMLILMDEDRNVWAERMFQGSLHYIRAGVAHRVANVGNEMLSFGACWPSDAGHDYNSIANDGFAARLVESNGSPVFKK